jgi:hypothetical protein
MKVLMSTSIIWLLFPAICVAQHDEIAKHVNTEYTRNQRMFSKYVADYTYETGNVILDKQGAVSKYDAEYKATCNHRLCGDCELFEQKGDRHNSKSLKPSAGKQSGESATLSPAQIDEKYLCFGEKSLTYSPTMNMLAYRDEDNSSNSSLHIPIYHFPGRANSMNLDYFFKSPNCVVTYIEETKVDGASCHRFMRKSLSDSSTWSYYYFSIRQGCLPIRREIYNSGQLVAKTNVTVVKRVNEECWYPEVVVSQAVNASVSNPAFSRYTTTHIVLSSDCKCDDLSFGLPAGTSVVDQKKLTSYKLRQDETIGVYDLTELSRKLAEKNANPTNAIDTTIKHTGQKSNLWFWILGGFGLILLGYGGYRWIRSRKRV